MLRSFLSLTVIATAFSVAIMGCSAKSPPAKPLPVVTVRTATMNVTPGIEVLARIALPDGFVPAPDYPPVWLQGGKEVAVAGTRNGHSMVVGYGGAAYLTARVLAEDGGIGAPDGNIVDVAASPDGMMLALAVAHPNLKSLDVVLRDVISPTGAHPISNYGGDFESVSIGWLNDFTVPLALRSRTADPASISENSALAVSSSRKPEAPASSGLYIINTSGVVTAGYIKLDCKLSRLRWAPKGDFAVGEGNAIAPAIIIDRKEESCQPINVRAPIRLLDWSQDSSAFLYEENNTVVGAGTYRYDVAKNTSRLVAIASGAAAFVSKSSILVLGSGGLNFRKIQNSPNGPCRAEVAVSNASGSDIDIQSLGLNSTPAMLADSRMTYTAASDTAAITTFSPTPTGPERKIVIYTVAAQRAFLVAFGPANGIVTTSWSPQGRYLAIADGDASGSALTIMNPPR
jgi:hypothetical protein